MSNLGFLSEGRGIAREPYARYLLRMCSMVRVFLDGGWTEANWVLWYRCVSENMENTPVAPFDMREIVSPCLYAESRGVMQTASEERGFAERIWGEGHPHSDPEWVRLGRRAGRGESFRRSVDSRVSIIPSADEIP